MSQDASPRPTPQKVDVLLGDTPARIWAATRSHCFQVPAEKCMNIHWRGTNQDCKRSASAQIRFCCQARFGRNEGQKKDQLVGLGTGDQGPFPPSTCPCRTGQWSGSAWGKGAAVPKGLRPGPSHGSCRGRHRAEGSGPSGALGTTPKEEQRPDLEQRGRPGTQRGGHAGPGPRSTRPRQFSDLQFHRTVLLLQLSLSLQIRP